ncbi:uncharacterized protein [Chelonus insularis]|uniref:uncharacterized protein isoform X2 n=1 Tax=Chelonus insularis TaxID=460826 RepID=UPI00158B8F5C|nr:uncharacterized protein LOC118068237 isoform X2 [Chelonus insularis]
MTFPYCDHSYYKEMLELQEKLRKRHEACINKLRMRYIEFLEEQRLRDERNHKLIDALDKVDSSLALMSAKTDKLHTLKREYEASLLRAHANQRVANSLAGDSGVMSQDEDRLTKKETLNKLKITSAPLYNYEERLKTTESFKNHYKPVGTLKQISPRTLSSSLLFKPSVHSEPLLQNRLTPSADYQRNLESKYTVEQSPIHTWKNDYTVDLNDFYKRDLRKNLIARESSAFRYLDPPKTPQTSKFKDLLSSMPNLKENYVENVNDDLASYINKIRNLHTNHDQSLEEVDHEQNTSGDLLNVTLSDDGLDHLPVEERKEKIILPEVNHGLAIADDLVSKIVDKGHTENCSKDLPSSKSQENDIPGSLNVIKPINPSTLIHSTLFDSNIKSVVLPEKSELMKAKVDDNIATQVIKLDQPIENTVLEQSQKNDDANIHVESEKENIHGDEEKFNSQDNKLNDVPANCSVKSEKTEKDFQLTPNLQHPSIENVEKQVEEIFIDETSNLNNFTQPAIQTANSLLSIHNSAINNEKDQMKAENEGLLLENNEDAVSVNDQMKNNTEAVKNLNEPHVESNEENILEAYEPGERMPQDVDQGYEYNQEQYQTEVNQDYQYETQEQYIENTDGHYQYEPYGEYMNDPNAQYQDPNFKFKDQQYSNNENQQYNEDEQHVQDENQQYIEDPNQQYQEYSQAPNQAYQQETYVQDPNQVYDPNDYNYSNQDEAFYQSNAYPENQVYSVKENQAYQEENQACQEEKIDSESNEKVEDGLVEKSNTKANNNEYAENQSIDETSEKDNTLTNDNVSKKQNDDIQTIRESDTDSTMEVNASNTENEFDFN